MPPLTRTTTQSSISTSMLSRTTMQSSISTNKSTSSRPQPDDSDDKESDNELIVVSDGDGGDTEEDMGQVEDDDELGECNLKF